MNVPLIAGMSLQLCGRLGRLFENERIMKQLPIDSLFFLGGPLSLRGFDIAGATPVHEGVAKGCRVYWASALHLWTPLPFSQHFGAFADLFRTHFFYNFGNCDSLSLGKNFSFQKMRERLIVFFFICFQKMQGSHVD